MYQNRPCIVITDKMIFIYPSCEKILPCIPKNKIWYFLLKTYIKPPLNYILDETPKTVELKYDEPAIVQFEDKAMSGLHI